MQRPFGILIFFIINCNILITLPCDITIYFNDIRDDHDADTEVWNATVNGLVTEGSLQFDEHNEVFLVGYELDEGAGTTRLNLKPGDLFTDYVDIYPRLDTFEPTFTYECDGANRGPITAVGFLVDANTRAPEFLQPTIDITVRSCWDTSVPLNWHPDKKIVVQDRDLTKLNANVRFTSNAEDLITIDEQEQTGGGNSFWDTEILVYLKQGQYLPVEGKSIVITATDPDKEDFTSTMTLNLNVEECEFVLPVPRFQESLLMTEAEYSDADVLIPIGNLLPGISSLEELAFVAHARGSDLEVVLDQVGGTLQNLRIKGPISEENTIGQNNVLLVQIEAKVVGDEERNAWAVVAVAFEIRQATTTPPPTTTECPVSEPATPCDCDTTATTEFTDFTACPSSEPTTPCDCDCDTSPTTEFTGTTGTGFTECPVSEPATPCDCDTTPTTEFTDFTACPSSEPATTPCECNCDSSPTTGSTGTDDPSTTTELIPSTSCAPCEGTTTLITFPTTPCDPCEPCTSSTTNGPTPTDSTTDSSTGSTDTGSTEGCATFDPTTSCPVTECPTTCAPFDPTTACPGFTECPTTCEPCTTFDPTTACPVTECPPTSQPGITSTTTACSVTQCPTSCEPCPEEEECSNTGMIAGIAAVAVLSAGALGAAGYFYWKLKAVSKADSFGRKLSFPKGKKNSLAPTPRANLNGGSDPGWSNPGYTPTEFGDGAGGSSGLQEVVTHPEPEFITPYATTSLLEASAPVASTSAAAIGLTAGSSVPVKSSLAKPKEIEPDYEELPFKNKSDASTPKPKSLKIADEVQIINPDGVESPDFESENL